MTLEQLRQEQTNLVLRRAALKDQVEGIEKALGQIGMSIQVLEANKPKPETEGEPEAS